MNQGLYEALLREQKEPFLGWDFKYLEQDGRMVEFPTTWHFSTVIKTYLAKSHSMLDMGTGGGEFLSSLAPLPAHCVATEGYQPNLEVATKRLSPLGVSVVAIESDDALPFHDGEFDLILNRHESFEAAEVARLLKNDGYFITQQVGGLNDCELNVWLCAQPSEYSNWSLRQAIKQLKEAGLTIIEAKDDITRTRFYDLGAIVYYLKVISWQIPDFTVEKYYPRLEALYHLIQEKGYVDLTKHRFLIIAKKEAKNDLY